MANSKNHVFLILSDYVSEALLRLYHQINAATSSYGSTFIVYHNRSGLPEPKLKGYQVYEFTDAILTDFGYTSIRSTLVPGSNHFPILQFYVDNAEFDYYWCIEDDVVFTGDWSSLFNPFVNDSKHDFLSSYIKHYKEQVNPDLYFCVYKENLLCENIWLGL
ncbi:hypothetical protein [Pedobacter sp.]|uniref:hypothetical protein n=1 Tax=Pedobacter sp. TaxID=1411316 RepID=UPI003BACD0F9